MTAARDEERAPEPRDPRLQRGDGRRHGRLAAQRLRPRRCCSPPRSATQLHADVFNDRATRSRTCSTSCWPAASSTPCWCPQLVRAMKNDPDGGEAYTNRIITLAALFLGRGHRRCWWSPRRWLMRLFLDRAYYDPALAAQRDSVDRLRPLLPAAGVLLRDVRAGRAGAQRPRPVRPDDVGADRQQRDLGRRPGRLPRSSFGAGRHGARAARRLHHRPGAAARPRLDARHRRPAAGPAARTCGPPAFTLPAALRLPRHRARPHPAAGHLDRAVRGRQPGRLHRRRPARLQRHGARRLRRPATTPTPPATRSTPRRSCS